MEDKKRKEKGREIEKQNKGITLVALVITIIIIIILATVTINMAFGDSGLIKQAKLAKDMAANSTTAEQEGMNSLMDEYANLLAEDSEIPPDTRSEIEIARDKGTVFDTKTELEDEHGNKVQVPGGFKIASDSGLTIQQGVVIEDVSASADTAVQGSQYVWIPVGIFTKDDGTTSGNIQLARYTFDRTNGTPIPHQYAINYTESISINYDGVEYIEKVIYDEGYENLQSGRNATAKDLKGFIDSVEENGGYYIARYEASYASGTTDTVEVGDYANCKTASKISTENSEESMSYKTGTLWNYITQPAASKVAINTYADSTSVKSDLINSYAWDTAIVYIQEAKNPKYSIETSKNSKLGNTGENSDEVCKINDLSSNLAEWTTEYSNFFNYQYPYECVLRGGHFSYDLDMTSNRGMDSPIYSYSSNGFRLILYIPTT
mgnify:CR=1 FL=1